MTGRPDLREILAACGLHAGAIDGVLDLHAHELAEKQRQLPLSGAEAGVRDVLANLIDPEARK
jgi:hypothetical protein